MQWRAPANTQAQLQAQPPNPRGVPMRREWSLRSQQDHRSCKSHSALCIAHPCFCASCTRPSPQMPLGVGVGGGTGRMESYIIGWRKCRSNAEPDRSLGSGCGLRGQPTYKRVSNRWEIRKIIIWGPQRMHKGLRGRTPVTQHSRSIGLRLIAKQTSHGTTTVVLWSCSPIALGTRGYTIPDKSVGYPRDI